VLSVFRGGSTAGLARGILLAVIARIRLVVRAEAGPARIR